MNTLMVSNVAGDLQIRAARQADRQVITGFLAELNGRDYIDLVWDEWLRDSSGPLLVAVLGDRPVGIAKLSDLGNREGWVHGVRVDPALAGRGIGRALLQHCSVLARRRGLRTLRLMTTIGNSAMRRVAELNNFRATARVSWFIGQTSSTSAPVIRPLSVTDLEQLANDLENDRRFGGWDGLYFCSWECRDLTPARLRLHLEYGEVYHLVGGTAWAIIELSDDLDDIWVGYAHGPQVEIMHLLRGALATMPGECIRILTPLEMPLGSAALQAGYQPDGDDDLVYERRL